MSENPNQTNAKRLKLKAPMDLDDAAEFEHLHKRAFRVAFDFLHACFPPDRSEEYWNAADERLKQLFENSPDNLLTKHLSLAVHNYLGDLTKDLMEEST